VIVELCTSVSFQALEDPLYHEEEELLSVHVTSMTLTKEEDCEKLNGLSLLSVVQH
jgi:hypothetical protein